MLIGQRVSGLIAVPSLSNKSLSRFLNEGIPVVALDRTLDGVASDEVAVPTSHDPIARLKRAEDMISFHLVKSSHWHI
jgi:hypothetical protein